MFDERKFATHKFDGERAEWGLTQQSLNLGSDAFHLHGETSLQESNTIILTDVTSLARIKLVSLF